MAETILSYLLAEESSNPQRILKKMGGLGSGEDGISPIPCGSGMENGKTGPRPSYHLLAEESSNRLDRAETILSYLLGWRVAIGKGFRKKTGGLGSGEDGISLIPCGPGWRMGRHGPWPRPSYRICWRSWRVAIRKGFRKKWAIWDQEKTASLLYPVGRGWRMGKHGRDHPIVFVGGGE